MVIPINRLIWSDGLFGELKLTQLFLQTNLKTPTSTSSSHCLKMWIIYWRIDGIRKASEICKFSCFMGFVVLIKCGCWEIKGVLTLQIGPIGRSRNNLFQSSCEPHLVYNTLKLGAVPLMVDNDSCAVARWVLFTVWVSGWKWRHPRSTILLP
jgi:hypothetical protein